MSVSHTLQHFAFPIIKKFGINVLGTITERAKRKSFFISLPFQNVGGFVNIFRRLRRCVRSTVHRTTSYYFCEDLQAQVLFNKYTLLKTNFGHISEYNINRLVVTFEALYPIK